MELLSTEFLMALLSIVVIDLVLAGDNAIVIGMSARNLPKHQQKKVILWGTVGAIIIRALATLAVVWLLGIPGLLLGGGLILIWIAYKLLAEGKKHDVEAAPSMWAAIRTIIIADAVMGLDNVLAVAGAAHNNYLLVILGLAVSVPIMVWGSTVILRLIERYPAIIYIGSAVLAFTAAKMITGEQMLAPFFNAQPVFKWLTITVVVVGVLVAGRVKKVKQNQLAQSEHPYI